MCQAPGWSLSLTFLTATPQGRAFCCHPCFRDEENESLIHRHKHGSKRQNQDLKLGGRTPSPHSASSPRAHHPLSACTPPVEELSASAARSVPNPPCSRAPSVPVSSWPSRGLLQKRNIYIRGLQVSCSLAAFIRRLLCARHSSQSDPQDPASPQGTLARR